MKILKHDEFGIYCLPTAKQLLSELPEGVSLVDVETTAGLPLAQSWEFRAAIRGSVRTSVYYTTRSDIDDPKGLYFEEPSEEWGISIREMLVTIDIRTGETEDGLHVHGYPSVESFEGCKVKSIGHALLEYGAFEEKGGW